jgi:hypothetical protein
MNYQIVDLVKIKLLTKLLCVALVTFLMQQAKTTDLVYHLLLRNFQRPRVYSDDVDCLSGISSKLEKKRVINSLRI